MLEMLKKSRLVIFLLILLSSILLITAYQIFYSDTNKNKTVINSNGENVIKQDIPKQDWTAKNGLLINSEDDSEIPVYIDSEQNSVPKQYTINVPSKKFILENQPSDEDKAKMQQAFLDFIKIGDKGRVGVYPYKIIQKVEILGFIDFNGRKWIHAKVSGNDRADSYFFGDFYFEKQGGEFIYTEYRHAFGGV